MTSAPQAGLQRVFRYAEFLGGFSGGITFDLAENERGPQQGPEFVAIFIDDLANFRSGVNLLGRTAIVLDALGARRLILVILFLHPNPPPTLSPPPPHDTRS